MKLLTLCTLGESLARSQAQRARRSALASDAAATQAPSAADENLPPPSHSSTASPPQLSTPSQRSQPTRSGLSFEELQELENDPDAEEDEEIAPPGATNVRAVFS